MDKAKDVLKKLYVFIKDKWSAANKNARIVTLAVAAAMLVAAVTLIALSSRTEFTVLYTGVSADEMSEIATALGGMGVTARIDGQTISIPRDVSDSVRMDLAIQGFPKAAFNYDIWHDNVGMFSTDADRKELQRQQLEWNLRATLRSLNDVIDANVMITPPVMDNAVLPSNREPARASVTLNIRPGASLKQNQIEGIRRIIMTAVPGLDLENLGLFNQVGVELIPDDISNAETQLALNMQKINWQNEFRRRFQEDLKNNIESLIEGTVRDFRVAVNVVLDFSEWERRSTTYEGANVDENGFQHGIIDYEELMIALNAIGEGGNLVGTTINSDISPGYPTLEDLQDAEVFYEYANRIQYKVDEYHTLANSNSFSIEQITIGVQIDEGNALPQDEIDIWRQLIARAAGTDIEDVSVRTTNFILSPAPPLIPPPAPSPVRNLLVFIIISLGALLIILFMLAIMSSGSKKRRLIRARAAAYQGAGASSVDDYDLGAYSFNKQQEEETEEIKIQSLLGAGEGETRDALLKNEIREFAKTNPDIVAQLIRTWIREP
ncbi:MAG: flagellar M-ring protein FliF [Oscillospiraceae bacterium]|jgi:flagellar M-ring protein FliF|nr:flagellar M-ring protein FliF [Oscillospiraceae bacterium]